MISRLHIQAEVKQERTFLKNVFFNPPFKISDITEDKKGKTLQLMLMSSSPGVLDNDAYDIKLELEEGSSLELQTQSFQRLFTMKQHASQHVEVVMKKGSSFQFLPHPVVPHREADFSAHNKIYLSKGCSLIWGEILTCGRKLNGEEFQFSKYHNLTEIFSDDKLVLKENLLIKPASHQVHAIGYLEGFTHQASFIFLNENAVVNEINDSVLALLEKENGITFGITAAPINGIIVRILGQHAEQLHTCLKNIAKLLPHTVESIESVYAK